MTWDHYLGGIFGECSYPAFVVAFCKLHRMKEPGEVAALLAQLERDATLLPRGSTRKHRERATRELWEASRLVAARRIESKRKGKA